MNTDSIEIRAVRFAHVDRDTGTTLAIFETAAEAYDALLLLGVGDACEIDAVFHGAGSGGAGSTVAVSPVPPVSVTPAWDTHVRVVCHNPLPWDVDTETARRVDERDGHESGSDW